MAILQFQQPDKVIMLEGSSTFGRFEFRPLEPGYGITIGNALRRILLSSLEGHAITWISIEGVDHEFSTIAGVIEDVTQLILNLKQVRFRLKPSDEVVDHEVGTLDITGSDLLRAGDLNRSLNFYEVVNGDLELCHMDPSVRLKMTFHVSRGRGYIPAEENAPKVLEFGMIPIDSIHTPIRNVMYRVDDFRVEQKTDYERLLLELTTDGTIYPKEALREAASILIDHFTLFSDDLIRPVARDEVSSSDEDMHVLEMRELLRTPLTEFNFSVRALNCLKAAGIEELSDLVRQSRSELLKIRNFGKKSLAEVDDVLEKMNLDFSMDLTRYKIDKD